MTREEKTIANLKKLKSFRNGSFGADIDRAIKALEQESKTGHWIYIGQSYPGSLKICECSNCKKRTYGSHDYCPNCGTKMTEEE